MDETEHGQAPSSPMSREMLGRGRSGLSTTGGIPRAEPRAGLDPVFTMRSGTSVAVLGEGPAWTQVEVRGRTGYLPTDAVGIVR